eukprot:2319852-Rhodomonas_salina.1
MKIPKGSYWESGEVYTRPCRSRSENSPRIPRSAWRVGALFCSFVVLGRRFVAGSGCRVRG